MKAIKPYVENIVLQALPIFRFHTASAQSGHHKARAVSTNNREPALSNLGGRRMTAQKKTKRKKPTEADRRHIIGRSGGCCNRCREPLFIEGEFGERARIGDDAHIIASSDIGPRGDESISPDSLANAGNLILLCKTCHSMVDQQPLEFPASQLLDIRDQHYEWVERSLGSRISKKPRFYYLCRAMHAAELCFVLVERRCADPVLPTDLSSRHSCFLLFYHPNDLFFREP